MFHGDEDIFRALEAGAASYVVKDTAFAELVHAIRQVHAGRPAMSPASAPNWPAARPGRR